MSLPFADQTYSVSALCEEIKDLLHQAYPEVWVAGEVNRIREHRSGHFYFELVEKGADDQITGKVEAVAWRNDFQKIRRVLAASDQEITEGQALRCRGRVDFYPPFGRLQLVVREIDPVFMIGMLAQRRREILAALAEAGLLERNRGLALPELPLRIGLVTSHESAAYHDFLSSLRESGYGFQVLFVHAAVQGREAERELVAAIDWFGRNRTDCLVLIRGGGSRSDLAVFDSRGVAEAIARSSVPVLTGLGHEIDQAIADLTAHTAFKTPTKVAEFLVEKVRGADRRLEEVSRVLTGAGLEMLRCGRKNLGRAERGLLQARWRLAKEASELDRVARQIPRIAERYFSESRRRLDLLPRSISAAAPLTVERSRHRMFRLADRISGRSELRLRELRERLSGWRRLCAQLAPERTLERGFSITRDAEGKALTAPAQTAPGERLVSQLAGGQVRSRVEEA